LIQPKGPGRLCELGESQRSPKNKRGAEGGRRQTGEGRWINA
jgi:hypothetical protein